MKVDEVLQKEIQRLSDRAKCYLIGLLKLLNDFRVEGFMPLTCGYCKQTFYIYSDTDCTRICPYCANPVIIEPKEPIRRAVPLQDFKNKLRKMGI